MLFGKCAKFLPYVAIPRKIAHYMLATVSSSSSATSTSSANAKAGTAPLKKPTPSDVTSDCVGQPTHKSHPHLINEGELVTGVCVEEFQQRRQHLMQRVQQYAFDHAHYGNRMKTNHVMIVPSSTKKFMSDKIPYVFRQNSDFFYLSGCLEPDTILMMTIDEHSDVKSTLFMRPNDSHAELWDGPRTGVHKSIELFGVDEAYSNEVFTQQLNRYVSKLRPLIWFDHATDLPKIAEEIRLMAADYGRMNSPTNFIQRMRLIKSSAEQAIMRQSCNIAAEAFNEVMQESCAGHTEHHLNAMIDFKCRMRNASYLAYPPVVASGLNSTTIHYINNSQMTKSGDIVLMDAGCEYGGYTSDITRTWAVDGTFTEPQKVIYDVVLRIQKDMIETMMKEGGETLDDLFDTMCIRMGKYMQEVGLVPKHISDSYGYGQAGFKFCPHHVSHYLGMDVHDTPLMPRNLRLTPGMVCTVEPGIYIGPHRDDVPKEFRGIGVRIEDDILITADDKLEVLTSSCVKDRALLERKSLSEQH